MKRRAFIDYSAWSAIGIGIGGMNYLSACRSPTAVTINSMGTDLLDITIDAMSQAFNDGSLSIVEVTAWYIDRIRSIDIAGPSINSVIYLNPQALEEAEALERELQNTGPRSRMHGIPVMLKDNIDTVDMPTTAGSRALSGSQPLRDSHVAYLLRQAGAILLGKTNLSEWANFRGEKSTSGWSGLGGLTKNPYVLNRNTCGSSAGSGAAVSANLCIVAIGTETNGSIVCPSSTNGIVGIKPTVGLISRAGIIPISSTQDTAGPMARCVSDAVHTLNIMRGQDERDQATDLIPPTLLPLDFTLHLNKNGLQGKRLAHYTQARGRLAAVDQLMSQAIQDMETQGATIIEIDTIAPEAVNEDSFAVMLYEYKEGLNNYFKSLGPNAPIKSLKELIEWNKKDSVELKYFGQEYLELAQNMDDLNSAEYKNHLENLKLRSRTEGIDRVMDLHQLDAIIAPTNSPAWYSDLSRGDTFVLGSSSPAAQSGYPNITVPMGMVDRLPVGISFFGRAWSEAQLIEIAYAYEQATLHRRTPGFEPS